MRQQWTKTKLSSQVALALVALSLSGTAFAGFFADGDKSQQINANADGNFVVEGNVYLEGHTWIGHQKSLTIKGDFLNVTTPTSEPVFELYSDSQATVHGKVDLDELRVNGSMAVGGSIDVGKLTITGNLTNLNGGALDQQVTVTKHLEVTGQDVTLKNFVAKADSSVVVKGGKFVVEGGSIGSVNGSVKGVAAYEGAQIEITGDVYAKDVNANTPQDAVIIKGTLHLTGSNSSGAGKLTVTNLEVSSPGWNQFDNLTVNVENDMVISRGTFGVLKDTKLTVGNALTLKGDAFLQYKPTDTPLNLQKLVLEKDSVTQDGFQTYGGPVQIGTVEVKGAGRIDAYSKENPNLAQSIKIGMVKVSEGSSFAVTNSREDNAADASKLTVSIDTLDVGQNATVENGVWKTPAEDKFRGGGNLIVKNLKGTNVKITNHNSAMTIGADADSQVALTGIIDDKNKGVALTLNQASSWIVSGESNVGTLAMNGGVTDVSTTTENLEVNNLTGSNGTFVLDAAKTNSVTLTKTEENTKVEVKASENADKVTTSQAEAMMNRLEGVTNKTGSVDEGMYQGAIAVDGKGNATQAKNGLMSDTLEVASASTLSLNRILMNDVRKRLGDVRTATDVHGVWARYDGGRLSGEGTKNKFNTIHVGGDTIPFADMPVRVGVAASYTQSDVDFTRGSADMDAFSVAAYGTWLAENGMFADVIARVAKADADMTVDGVYKGKLENMAYSLSGEFGWRFDLNDQFYAEPQVEATYTYIDSDKMTLAHKGETYNYQVEGFDSFIGRMGVLAGMKCPNQKGDVYVRASVVHEFLGDATIKGGQTAVLENEGKDTWFEYGIGANFNLGKNTYFWADLESTAGALVDEDIRGSLGVRFGF